MVSHSQGCLGTQTWDPLVSVNLSIEISDMDTSSFWVCSLFCCTAVGPPSTTWASSFPAEGSCPASSASPSSLYFSVPGFLDSRLEPCFCSCLPVVALWGAILVCADFHKWPSLACVFSTGFVSGWSSELPRDGCTVFPVSLPQGPILACFLNPLAYMHGAPLYPWISHVWI